MPKIKLAALQEGMLVAADVKNMDDMLLIPAGCELTQRHIKVLQTWGVLEVEVELGDETEVETDPLAKMDPAEAAKLAASVKERFWNFDESNPVQLELFQAVLRRAARDLAESQSRRANPVS